MSQVNHTLTLIPFLALAFDPTRPHRAVAMATRVATAVERLLVTITAHPPVVAHAAVTMVMTLEAEAAETGVREARALFLLAVGSYKSVKTEECKKPDGLKYWLHNQ